MGKIKRLYLEVIQKNKKYPVLYSCLKALSFLYCRLAEIRDFLYRRNLLYKGNCASFVVSVGNISWGGSGKTSLVIKLAHYFNARFHVAVLRRGYGRDEAMLLRENLPPEIEILSGKDRLCLAQKAAARGKIIILDDGFQYRRLRRNMDIVLLNASQDLEALCLPAGPLREPLKAIKRADIIIIREAGGRKEGALKLIKNINSSAPVYFASYRLREFRDIKSGMSKPAIEEAAVLTAIGWPQGFISLLEAAGVRLQEKFIYPDHSILSRHEWERIENVCRYRGIENLVITAKDKARVYPSRLNIFVAEADLAIEAEEDFLKIIEDEAVRFYL